MSHYQAVSPGRIAVIGCLTALCISLAGCANRVIDHRPPAETALIHGFPGEHTPVGRELEKVSLPPYVIEPPDILTIEALRVVPKAPYRIRAA